MGLAIISKNKSIDIPYYSFYRLRLVVAKCTDERLGHLYEMIRDANTEAELREHDILINVYYENAPDNIRKIIRFLYMPDSDGKIGKRMCKVIYERLKIIQIILFMDMPDGKIPHVFPTSKTLLKTARKITELCGINNDSVLK